jgi:adhesin transport system membrane fusion protein
MKKHAQGPDHGHGHDPMPLLDDRAGFSAFDLTHSPESIRRMSRLLLGGFVVLMFGLLVLPWQQFVPGAGRVVAFDPLERSVTVEAPLSGRVQRAHVVEGKPVKQGDVLFELMDNDPELLSNLLSQRAAADSRRQAAEARVAALTAQLAELERALPMAIEAAKTRLDAARFAAITASQQFERVRSLFTNKRGLASQRDYELALLERDRTTAEQARAEAELGRAEADLRASLNSSTALRDSAKADLASAQQSLVSLDIQVSQTRMQRVIAPRDGIVFRVQATEGTFLKAGTPLCTVIPETDNRMVELWMRGNDMPLVQAREVDEHGNTVKPGSPVRLQFEGWPAIQFVGWPSAAIGTFGGEVVLIDPTDNGKGNFRVLVAENPDTIRRASGEARVHKWPGDRWLRQGVRANGWVLLQRVPLWFEVWRQMNGFPPALSEEQIETTKK